MRQQITPYESMPTTIILTHTGNSGDTKSYNFIDGSIRYYESVLKNAFTYTLFDNMGDGRVRISYNRPALDLSNYINGAKTLKSGDSLYIEETISNIKIYFIEDSTIEIILKSAKTE